MRVLLIVAGVAAVAALLVFQQSMGVTPADLWVSVQSWSPAQQIAAATIVAAFAFVMAVALRQSDRIAQQSRAVDILQKRISGLRDDAAVAGEQQGGADAAVRHLIGTDPVATVDDVQQRLAEAEKRASEQAVQNEAVDLQSRIDEIRRRQQALRTQLGTVSEKRRTIEPMLGELKERQIQIERALGDLEKDESGKSVAARLEDAERFLGGGHARVDALSAALGTLNGLGERLKRLQDDTAPLKHPESGVKALLSNVVTQQSQIDAILLLLEKDDSEAIDARIERLSKSRSEIEQRISTLAESLGSLEAIRGEVGSQFEKLQGVLDRHLKR